MTPRIALFALLLPVTGFCRVEQWILRGPSMLPVLPVESVQRVDTSPEAFDRIAYGSIPIFKDPTSPSGYTSHAVFKQVKPGVWWTHGVNKKVCRWADSVYVTRENFVGILLDVSVPVEARK